MFNDAVFTQMDVRRGGSIRTIRNEREVSREAVSVSVSVRLLAKGIVIWVFDFGHTLNGFED